MHGNYFKGLLLYGFFMGIALSLVVLFRSWLTMPLSQPVSYAENIALLVFMFIAVYLYKNNLEEKKITFKESYIVAFGSAVVASIIYGFFLYLYAKYIDLSFQERCFSLQRAIEANSQFTDSQIRQMSQPSYIAFSAIMLSSVMSILWAMVVGILLRNEKGTVVTKVKELIDEEKKEKRRKEKQDAE